MASTGLDSFDSTIQKTNTMFSEIEQELGWQGRREQTYNIVRAVLHTMRDRLGVNEAAQLGAQLPMLVRGFYYEGWDPSRTPLDMNEEAFLTRIREEFPFELANDIALEDVIQVIMKTLRHITDAKELEEVIDQMPKDLAQLLSR